MVITAFQQNGPWEDIPYPEVDTYRSNGIGQDLLYGCFDLHMFHMLYIFHNGLPGRSKKKGLP
jgi:hypothetical protein